MKHEDNRKSLNVLDLRLLEAGEYAKDVPLHACLLLAVSLGTCYQLLLDAEYGARPWQAQSQSSWKKTAQTEVVFVEHTLPVGKHR